MLQSLADNTNSYAASHQPAQGDHTRKWRKTTTREMRAYLATYIYMGLHLEASIGDYWNSYEKNGPLYRLVSKYIGKNRWEQLDRFFHVLPPPHEMAEPSNLFEKLQPLSSTLQFSCKRYWKRGTYIAVDKSIQRFIGRSKETVNIPSKPQPEGFKIWILAN